MIILRTRPVTKARTLIHIYLATMFIIAVAASVSMNSLQTSWYTITITIYDNETTIMRVCNAKCQGYNSNVNHMHAQV